MAKELGYTGEKTLEGVKQFLTLIILYGTIVLKRLNNIKLNMVQHLNQILLKSLHTVYMLKMSGIW